MVIYLKAGFKQGRNILFRLLARICVLRRSEIKDYKHIPIIINNFNRLEYLQKLIRWLEKAGMMRIYIVDNNSTYRPLLEFYRKTKYIVFRLDKNVGYEALWRTHIMMLFKDQYYIYTDPDILPIDECPLDAVKYFMDILSQYPQYDKVGFGLKIDDLPDCYDKKQKVIDWEKKYLEKEIAKNLFEARIDTTFALYRPNMRHQCWDKTLRTGYPYVARHLPWYEDSLNLDEESRYYYRTASESSSWYISHSRYNVEN